MKPLRQLCAVTILTFVFAFPAFAGNIECGDVPPPPDPPAAIMGNIECGFTPTARTSDTDTAFVDPVTALTLNILQSVLSLF